MIIISAIFLFITVSYALLILLLRSGFKNLIGPADDLQMPEDLFISIVIPLRNEYGNLPALFDSLGNQSYPPAFFEVIFIDDHSDDGSTDIVSEECNHHPNYMLLKLGEDEAGKKAAIAKGVSRAKGSYILQTDGDVWFGSDYVREFALRIGETDADLIAGPVSFKSKQPGLLHTFEIMDHFALTGTAAGSFYFNDPLMCSAANLCYRKSLHGETRRYDPALKTPSGDDMFLLIGAKKLKKRTGYLKSGRAMVYTGSSGTPGSFVRKRIRWGSKTIYYRDPDIIWVAILVILTNLGMLVAPLCICWIHDLWKVFIMMVAIKSLADFLLLYTVGRFMKQTALLWAYPLIAVLYYFYFVYILIASLFRRVEWKGRSY